MLHHIEIYVRDLEKTRAFYDFLLPKLGYEIYQKWDAGFSYKSDREYIVFVQVKDKYKEVDYNRCCVGLNHLAFSCEDRSIISEILVELEKRKVHMLYDHKYYNFENDFSIFFEDPDRIKLEIRLDTSKKVL